MENLVVVATFTYRHEAELAQTALDAAGIQSVVSADDAGGEVVGLDFVLGARLLVRGEDEERAIEVLDSTAGVTPEEPFEELPKE